MRISCGIKLHACYAALESRDLLRHILPKGRAAGSMVDSCPYFDKDIPKASKTAKIVNQS